MQANTQYEASALPAQFHAQATTLYAACLGYDQIPDLIALQDKCRQDNPAALIPRTHEDYKNAMHAGHRHFGIFHNGRLIAHTRIGPDKADAADPEHEAALCAVMVDPGWRGYKLAHMLIQLGIQHAQDMGYINLNTRVHPDNTPMWTTFQKHGFIYDQLAKSHERPAEPDCPVYHYKRRLDTRWG